MIDPKIQAFLRTIQELRGDQFELIVRLREIVLASGSSVSEEFKYGGILFSSDVNFCGIFSYDHHVTLEFSNGAKIEDVHKLLKGRGKYRRHLQLFNLGEIETSHVRDYIMMARIASDTDSFRRS